MLPNCLNEFIIIVSYGSLLCVVLFVFDEDELISFLMKLMLWIKGTCKGDWTLIGYPYCNSTVFIQLKLRELKIRGHRTTLKPVDFRRPESGLGE